VTQQLSPAAQATYDAFNRAGFYNFETDRKALAAALRAVAKHCVPDDSQGYWVYIPHVLTVADELEAYEPNF